MMYCFGILLNWIIAPCRPKQAGIFNVLLQYKMYEEHICRAQWLPKVWVCGRSLAGILGSNPTGGHGCLVILQYKIYDEHVCRSQWLSKL